MSHIGSASAQDVSSATALQNGTASELGSRGFLTAIRTNTNAKLSATSAHSLCATCSLPPKKKAELFAEVIESGGFKEDRIQTIEEACRAYAKGRPDAEGRFKRHVYSDPIAKVKLDKLRRHHLKEWRDRLEQKPALVSRSKNGAKRYRDRSRSSINRDMVPVRASLFKVLAPGAPGTEAAWQEALTPIRNADTQRTLYLDMPQRRELLNHVSEVSVVRTFGAMCGVD